MTKKRKYTPDKGPLNRVSAIYKGKTKDKKMTGLRVEVYNNNIEGALKKFKKLLKNTEQKKTE